MTNMGMSSRTNFPIYRSLNRSTRGSRESLIIIQGYDAFIIHYTYTCNILLYYVKFIVIKRYMKGLVK